MDEAVICMDVGLKKLQSSTEGAKSGFARS